MAHSISGASLTPVLERLNATENYHPLDAEMFDDFTMEAGDIITIARGNENYKSPVHSISTTWRGGEAVCEVNSTGKQHRDPVNVVAKKKFGRSGAGMRNDKDLYYEITSEDGLLHTLILATASGIMTEVAYNEGELLSVILQTATNVFSGVYDRVSNNFSTIEQTASAVTIAVNSAKGELTSLIRSTSTNVFSGVYNKVSDNFSTIEQTASAISIAVTAAKSSLYTAILQTSTNIMTEVGKKSKVYAQPTDPSLTNVIYEGDMWIKTNGIRSWNDVAGLKWNAVATMKWNDLYGSEHYVWKNGGWRKVGDERTVIEQKVKVEQTSDSYSILARDVDNLGKAINSQIRVTAKEIRTEVNGTNSNIYGAINVQRDRISLVVSGEGPNATVSKASIILAINSTGDTSATISANRINLNGYVKATDITADYIAGKIAQIATVGVQNLYSERGGISVASVGTTTFIQGGVTCYVPSAIRDIRIYDSGTGTYKLQRKRFNDSNWVDCGSFVIP